MSVYYPHLINYRKASAIGKSPVLNSFLPYDLSKRIGLAASYQPGQSFAFNENATQEQQEAYDKAREPEEFNAVFKSLNLPLQVGDYIYVWGDDVLAFWDGENFIETENHAKTPEKWSALWDFPLRHWPFRETVNFKPGPVLDQLRRNVIINYIGPDEQDWRAMSWFTFHDHVYRVFFASGFEGAFDEENWLVSVFDKAEGEDWRPEFDMIYGN